MGATAVATAPPDEQWVRALEERIARVCGQLNALHGELVELIGEALDTKAWQQWGIRSIEQYVCWKTGLASGSVRKLVHIAQRRDELPETIAALGRGELSVDQTAIVVAHAPADVDKQVMEFAREATASQLRAGLGKYQWKQPANEAEPQPPREDAFGTFDEQGRYHLSVHAPNDVGLVIDAALHEARDALFNAGHPDVTWLDAMREVAERSLDTITSPSRRDRFRVYLHFGMDQAEDDDGPQAWFNAGPATPAWLRDLICCNCLVRPLWESEGIPISVGRLRHIVPERTRRSVLDRDRCCLHPGCRARTFLEVHHIVDWIKGGMTDLDNLVALCPKHHTAHHRGEYTMAGNANVPGGLRFYDGRGRPIPPVATPVVPTGPPEVKVRYEHPSGERFNRHDLYFTQN